MTCARARAGYMCHCGCIESDRGTKVGKNVSQSTYSSRTTEITQKPSLCGDVSIDCGKQISCTKQDDLLRADREQALITK